MNRRVFLKGLLAGAVAAPGLVAAASKVDHIAEPSKKVEPEVSGYAINQALEALKNTIDAQQDIIRGYAARELDRPPRDVWDELRDMTDEQRAAVFEAAGFGTVAQARPNWQPDWTVRMPTATAPIYPTVPYFASASGSSAVWLADPIDLREVR